MTLTSILQKTKEASRKLAITDDVKIAQVLNKIASDLMKNSKKILTANKKDLNKIDKNDPIYDRVLLDKKRIKDIADSMRLIAKYDSPIGKILEKRTLKSGLKLTKISVPFGVIGVIFEARPNVLVDVFAICFKSKNACVLKGGSLSANSNKVLMEIIKNTLKKSFGNMDMAVLLSNDRSVVGEFLLANKYVDLMIPRGGQGLIDFVRENSSIPVIETGAGVVHTFFDESGDTKKGADIVFNEKTTRPSLCNALDTLIIHQKRLSDLPVICKKLAEKNVIIFADEKAYKALDKKYPKLLLFKVKPENFGKEYLSLQMSIKTVKNLDEAIEHITTFGSKHSEAIITENKTNAEKFLKMIDAACVYVNTSTRFTDGGEFGLGAEIGISTQKLHARGPMGIEALVSYKWQVVGTGQIR